MEAKLQSRVGRRIHEELDVAKQQLEALAPAIAIYGGARVKPGTPAYVAARELARQASARGTPVIAGGGPGVMEAANRGAQEGSNGKSVGLNVILPFEQVPNAYQDLSVTFDHFAARKVAFAKYSAVFVAFEGGFGTLDEIFEVLTLVQTGKMPEIPVLLYGRKFWAGLVAWMDEMMLQRGLVSAEDLSRRVRIVDSIDETMEIIEAELEKRRLVRAT